MKQYISAAILALTCSVANAATVGYELTFDGSDKIPGYGKPANAVWTVLKNVSNSARITGIAMTLNASDAIFDFLSKKAKDRQSELDYLNARRPGWCQAGACEIDYTQMTVTGIDDVNASGHTRSFSIDFGDFPVGALAIAILDVDPLDAAGTPIETTYTGLYAGGTPGNSQLLGTLGALLGGGGTEVRVSFDNGTVLTQNLLYHSRYGAEDIDVTINNGSRRYYQTVHTVDVQPAPVPLPAALPMALAGVGALAGLGWAGRRRAG